MLKAQALLKRYSATNQRPPPTSILFYRDGVSGECLPALAKSSELTDRLRRV